MVDVTTSPLLSRPLLSEFEKMQKILIFGNSGAGKSTLAARLSSEYAIPHLDLGSVGWASPAIRKEFIESKAEIETFMAQHDRWVIEGCYGSLLEVVAPCCTEMHFLNPGIEACLANNLRRPWEPHKYPSKEAQDKNLDMLQAWVKEYASRDDEYSLQYHEKIFSGYKGKKTEYLHTIS